MEKGQRVGVFQNQQVPIPHELYLPVSFFASSVIPALCEEAKLKMACEWRGADSDVK